MMNAIKRHLIFAVWIACCLVLIVLEVGWFLQLRRNLGPELAAAEMKTRQRTEWMREVSLTVPEEPGLPAEQPNLMLTVADGEISPPKPLDGFIAIAGTVETLRRLATAQEVSIAPGEFFGFATYAHQGPKESDLSAVHQQTGLTRLLGEKLLAARPGSLVAVRRERPSPDGRPGPDEVAADFFQLDSRLDLRLPGLIDGRAIRFEFTGPTTVLRTFLQSLAESPEPLLVRCVEVESLPPSAKLRAKGAKIGVVVELAKSGLVGGSGRNKYAEPIAAAAWETPPGDSAGGDPGYGLFDPPDYPGRVPVPSLGGAPLPPLAGSPVGPGLELLAVKREPYRLQLVGYYGAPGDYTVAFVSPGSPETWRVREGHRFGSLGLVLNSFSLLKCATKNQDGPPGYEMTACARLWDERTQEPVLLLGSEPLLTDSPLAIFRFGPAPARAREFRPGESFQDGAAACRIESIQLDPAEVVITRQEPGAGPSQRQVLHPADSHKKRALPDLAAADLSP